MKKVFVFFAVASMFVACNKPAQKVEQTTDSVVTEVVAPVDSAAQAAADSVAKAATVAADSVAQAAATAVKK